MKKPAKKKVIAKKSTKKPVAKASSKKRNVKKQKGPNAIVAPAQMHRVEMEHNSEEFTTYIPAAGREKVELSVAETAMQELKDMGVGGRIIRIEDGAVISSWASVEKAAENEKAEKAALEAKA